ncbi:sensor histidine kinase [Thiospirochaeta perfilievii]|uniref:histidine kinase n=1 Tax=Thiospirochaeta perfilievii TaxID=252967 RepID=A0A5C1QBB5_9SPIO|nr:ATP-binding protein [Thiospirochaeta perfilievii]QEN05423.1 sensor histidine kinase [Thiospirochaeta perfilievii]
MRLQKKILYTVLISTIFFTFIREIVSFFDAKNIAERGLEQKIVVTGKLMQGVLANPLYNLNYNLLEESLLHFYEDPDIISIKLVESGGILEINKQKDTSTNQYTIKQHIKIVYREVYLGDVEVVYSEINIIEKLRDKVFKSILSISLLIGIITLFLLFSIQKIIKPVKELTDLSVEISNGNLEKSIDIYSSDEIGILAKSFIVMKDSIKSQLEQIQNEVAQKDIAEKTLQELNNNLEEKVNERTRELEEALENIKNTQKKLIESEKMASLGILVAGVAHEINTPIGIAVTAASHLQDEVKVFSSKYMDNQITRSGMEGFLKVCDEITEIILSNMYKGRTLVRSFKNIAVDQTSEQMREFELKSYLEEILLSTHSKFKRTGIKINVICDEGIKLHSYPGALSQVITNLLLNSLYHGFENISQGEIIILVSENDQNIIINYSDTGSGIPKEFVSKVFNPFFTTKRGKGGSGLGLSIVYNLVTSVLNGDIECSSIEGSGVTFIITIPTVAKKIEDS